MRWSRRDFLRLIGAAGATAPLLKLSGCAAEDLGEPVRMSGTGDLTGGHHITGQGLGSGRAFQLGVPSRGHGAAVHPAGTEVAVVARRSGTEVYIVDLATGDLAHTIV